MIVLRYSLLFNILLLLSFQSDAQSYYRSKASGNWNNVNTWESAPAAVGPWVNAVATPNSADYAVTIQSPHVVNITATVTIDEVTINLGATLAATGAITVTINNGVGIDLINNGTFSDAITGASIVFALNAKWSMSSGATLLKTTASGGAPWQMNYQGGIATIPATANWILRKTNGLMPAINTTQPATGSVYPNLILENNTGSQWITTTIAGSFTGFAAFPTIKGNLDVGGTGTNTVSFLNEQTNASPTLVNGSVIIRTGNILRNYGTGLEIQGNLTVNGTLSYDASDARRLVFSGINPQSISGTGTINIWDMRMNKSSNDLTLNRAITVDNQLDLSWGRIFSSASNLLTLIDGATVINTNNSSFVHGPIRKNGDGAFIFPVGKNNDYQPVEIGSGGGSGTITFWSENFGTGCNQGNPATSYTGPNGTWTQTLTGANQNEANSWYISATEAGMGTGNCGNGCLNSGALTNRTLHVGANDGFTATDPGAAYNAGGLCGVLFCVTTSKRINSPVINCTGMNNINVSFNYIENGQGSSDNATLWYDDGSGTWINIYDMPKTATCSGQGLWTYTTITLPASANNNPNVKIGFRWDNNDDGAGTDPSFAVDDIQLSVNGTEVFTAEYFRGNPRVLFGITTVPSLVSISGCEYWQVDHNSGNSNRIVSLNWDLNSCGITNIGNLRVARWDIPGLIWQDEGNGGATGTVAAGKIPSGNFIGTYGTFTLSAIDAQPLPMELLAFDAVYNGKTVDLSWETASEQHTSHFYVERSENATDFFSIGSLNAAGFSNSIRSYYMEDKNPYTGISYYRLRQTDINGKSFFSNPERIIISDNSSFIVYPDADNHHLTIYAGIAEFRNCKMELFDVRGKIILERKINGNSPVVIETGQLARGMYLMRLNNKSHDFFARFIY